MAHISEPAEAKPLINPFFTREQMYALSQAPNDEAVKDVRKQGSNQDYLPGEYIRILLNRFIGPGMWEMTAELVGQHVETLNKEVWKEPEGGGRKVKVQVPQVAVTANVAVKLTIHARDGSDRTLVHSAVGSHVMYGGAEQGAGAIFGNAIKSAETSGLKRAAMNLGRAFGLDLKNKVTSDMLPPSILQYRDMLSQQDARKRQEVPVLGAANEVAPRLSAVPKPAPQSLEDHSATSPKEKVESLNAAAPVKGEGERNVQQEPMQEKAQPASTSPQIAAVKAEEATEAKSAPKASPEAPQMNPPSQTQAKANVVQPIVAATEADGDEDWELSMKPVTYGDWLKCIKTMAKRVSQMTSTRELDNFIKRYPKLIKELPVLPAEGDRTAKDFKSRWKKIASNRYQQLGGPIPAEYADIALADAA